MVFVRSRTRWVLPAVQLETELPESRMDTSKGCSSQVPADVVVVMEVEGGRLGVGNRGYKVEGTTPGRCYRAVEEE